MSLGIIARCDQRGISHQTAEAIKGLKPDKVLVVQMNDPKWPEDPYRYGRKDVTIIDSDMRTRQLDETKVRKFLNGLTCVFAVETVYDWRMIEWADDVGCKVVVQGNVEFVTHHDFPDRPQPIWVWPTRWLEDHELRPAGSLLPVPAPDIVEGWAADPEDEVLRVVHVAGHRAIGDRNGTDIFMEALKLIGSRVHVTVIGQDGQLPEYKPGRHVTVDLVKSGVEDRWDLYRGQHTCVLPRRYGGLCLPAIEASSRGVVPMMPDVPENSLWPILPVPPRSGRLQRVPFGRVPTWAVRPNALAYEIDKINKNRDRLADAQDRAVRWADDNSWESWLPQYREVLQ